MKRGEQTPMPPERRQTVRRRILDCLRAGPVSISALSPEVGLSEKQLREHLASLRKQVRLVITPARCGKCGFEFTKRRRVAKPGKCPACQGTYIEAPRFSIADQ